MKGGTVVWRERTEVRPEPRTGDRAGARLVHHHGSFRLPLWTNLSISSQTEPGTNSCGSSEADGGKERSEALAAFPCAKLTATADKPDH